MIPRPSTRIVRDSATERIVVAGPTGREALDAARRLGFVSAVSRPATWFELAVLDIRSDCAVAPLACFVRGGSGRRPGGLECRSCGGSGEERL